MFIKVKDFIETWKHVNSVNSLNRDLKNKNEELNKLIENYKNALIEDSNTIVKLKTKVELAETDRDVEIANKKVDYINIDGLLEQLENVNRSGLADKTKEQNIIINEIRRIIKKELDNTSNID